MNGARTSLAPICVLLVLSGCYRYSPTDPSLTPAGEEVRVLVTRAGATELAEVAPEAGGGGVITGVVQGSEDDHLLMSVAVAQRQEGMRVINMMQTIRVPRGEILGMELRQVNTIGTGLLLAGGVALGVGVVLGIMEAFGTGQGEGDPPPVDFSGTIGSFSFPWGR
jgi:hypothetical protein